MISHRIRESRRVKALKLPKTVERLYKESKCRDCAVVVTRMDFAKILGKFTKVKIQYESSATPKTKQRGEVVSPNSNARLKSNENGMVLIHRNAYNQHPVKDLKSSKKPKATSVTPVSPRQVSNVLKENNRLKKTPAVKDKNANINISSPKYVSKKSNDLQFKEYGIIFTNPSSNNKNDISNITLADLLPLIDKSILPNEEWSIDYLPHSEAPKGDKVYDRIAAELEDLMYNEKPVTKPEEKSESVSKVDEFPSIMDILNDNSSGSTKLMDQSTSDNLKPNLESSDVEAMLLGKSSESDNGLSQTPMNIEESNKDVASSAMEVDMSNLIEHVTQFNAIPVTEDEIKVSVPIVEEIDNPHSPSILDEALQKGIEEHLPCMVEQNKEEAAEQKIAGDNDISINGITEPSSIGTNVGEKQVIDEKRSWPTNTTHLIFKKNIDGDRSKCVTCPKNMKYIVELDSKAVEFLGAPKYISSLEDLKVLLQIVDETELESLYVFH